MILLVIEYNITDYYPVMVIISNKLNSRRGHNEPILRRSFAKFSVDDFNHELQDRITEFLDVNIAINETNVDELFNEFYSVITQTIHIHAPLKKLTRKQKRLQRKPWITEGILISIKRKQKTHKTHFINGSSMKKYFD